MKDEKIKYIGGERYIVGIPRRDLSLAEWESLSEELRSAAIAAKVYALPEASSSEKESAK